MGDIQQHDLTNIPVNLVDDQIRQILGISAKSNPIIRPFHPNVKSTPLYDEEALLDVFLRLRNQEPDSTIEGKKAQLNRYNLSHWKSRSVHELIETCRVGQKPLRVYKTKTNGLAFVINCYNTKDMEVLTYLKEGVFPDFFSRKLIRITKSAHDATRSSFHRNEVYALVVSVDLPEALANLT
jgi:hypothetical protein